MHIAFAGFRHDHIYKIYWEALQNQAFTIAGAFEEDARTRENAADKYGVTFTYDSYEELLQDAAVEVIAIGDYYGKRGRMIIDALKHGKHVICDKPLCTDPEELKEIEKIADEHKLQVMCMLDLRYLPQVSKAKEIIESGILGEIHIVSFTGQHPLNYGSRPRWYFEPGKHGGTINDIGIHGVDLVRYLTGKNLTKLHYARTWNAFADREPAFQDCGQFAAEMDGMSVMADVSYAAPKCGYSMPTYWNFYFWGSKGTLHFSQNDKKLHIYTDHEEIVECGEGSGKFLQDFMLEIRGIPTIMNAKSMIESQRQTLKIQRAADSKSEGGILC